MELEAKSLELDPVSVTPSQTRLKPLWLRILLLGLWLYPPQGKLQTPEDKNRGWGKKESAREEGSCDLRDWGEREGSGKDHR